MNNTQNIDFTVDKNNLYREDSVTDLKVASIKKLIPVNLDGSEDTNRTHVFYGHTQLMSPQGPVPIQATLVANNLEEAIDIFPVAMKKTFDEMVAKIQKMQEEQKRTQGQQAQNDSRIIMPGR
ncbi:MAG: cytoplasmic protein [Deltaproteobacteria bacterium]|nr:cytoplasmic protein [Deltaproteobacteria bacterium]